jgi:riboflavin-specific deaminase-like protein
MEELLPVPGPVDPAAAHALIARTAPAGRPWVMVNMVASADGATSIDGVSGGLGGPADKEVFSAIRAVADVILVAGGTVRAEQYGPPRTPPVRRAERGSRGQAPYPRIAVVSGSLDLDPGSPMFTDAAEPPLVYTAAAAPAERREQLEAVAEVVVVEGDRVDVGAVIGDLYSRGARVVLVEGGPSLNGQLAAAGLVDELDLTTSPILAGGSSPRIVVGGSSRPRPLELAHLWTADGLLFARYVAR